MSGTIFLDALAIVGPRSQKPPLEPWSLSHLLAEMEQAAISGALVHSTQSVLYDPHLGNLRLSEELCSHADLHAVWNLMPTAGGEFPLTKEWLPLARAKGVKAFSIAPKTNGWDLNAPSSQDLFLTLQKEKLPLFIARPELENYGELRWLLAAYPQLPVVLTGALYADQRRVVPMLLESKNLHITFDRFQIHYGPEDLVQMGLEEQLLFGSSAPGMSAGAHRCYIDYAEIPQASKQKIAAGNLCRLLGIPLPDAASAPERDDFLMQAARRGQPLPAVLIDMHMHILDEGSHGGGGSYRMKHGGPQGVFHLLRRLGCTGGGFMSWNGTVSCDSRRGNDCVIQALDGAPNGFWGLGSFDPCHFSPAEMEAAIVDLYRDRRFVGMKPYIRQGVAYDDPSYDPWWEYGNRHGLYALLHRTRGDFSEAVNLARRFPNVEWVVAHCAAGFAVADQAAAALAEAPNLYAEITLTPVGSGVIEHLVKGCGAHRVLYGSDLPMRDPRQQLGWVVHSRLSVEEKLQVLGQNALKLLTRVRGGALAPAAP